MDCACVTILEKNCVESALESPRAAFGKRLNGLVCATVIQDTGESVESLTRRVGRRLSLIAPHLAQCLRVVYRVGRDHSVAARAARMRLCHEAMGWLVQCKEGAQLLLVLSEPPDPAVRQEFMSLIGELNRNAGGVAISITFDAAPRWRTSHTGQVRYGRKRSGARSASVAA